jgi:hypothetical protein
MDGGAVLKKDGRDGTRLQDFLAIFVSSHPLCGDSPNAMYLGHAHRNQHDATAAHVLDRIPDFKATDSMVQIIVRCKNISKEPQLSPIEAGLGSYSSARLRQWRHVGSTIWVVPGSC